MTQHAAPDRLVALRLGQLSGEESRELLNHVATCTECQRAAQAALEVRTDARELAQSLAAEDAVGRRVPARRWLAVAAVAAGVLVAIPFLQREEPPAVQPPVVVTKTAPPVPPPGPVATPSQPWSALVAEAVRTGVLEAPAVVLSVRASPDQFRDDPNVVPAPPGMRPQAEVVESDRPLFRWPETSGATYTVLVGEKGRIVAQSSTLTTNTWRSDKALPRGRTYSWQVETRRGEETALLPVPPAPLPRFHVLEARLKAQLDAARRAVPSDDLVLGILAAHAGLRDTALEHLRAAAERGVPEAQPLLDSVRKWPAASS